MGVHSKRGRSGEREDERRGAAGGGGPGGQGGLVRLQLGQAKPHWSPDGGFLALLDCAPEALCPRPGGRPLVFPGGPGAAAGRPQTGAGPAGGAGAGRLSLLHPGGPVALAALVRGAGGPAPLAVFLPGHRPLAADAAGAGGGAGAAAGAAALHRRAGLRVRRGGGRDDLLRPPPRPGGGRHLAGGGLPGRPERERLPRDGGLCRHLPGEERRPRRGAAGRAGLPRPRGGLVFGLRRTGGGPGGPHLRAGGAAGHQRPQKGDPEAALPLLPRPHDKALQQALHRRGGGRLPARAPAGAAPAPCCSSTWTTSRGSTTATATSLATRSSPRSAPGCGPTFAPPTSWAGWGATSSWSL